MLFQSPNSTPTVCWLTGFFALVSCANAGLLQADQANEAVVPQEFFDAIDTGDIEVKIIPLDATKANILVRNLSDKPVNLKLPEAFASVPVLAQFGGGGGGGLGGGGGGFGGGGGGGGQAGGGGLGGGGIGGGGGLGGGGGGFGGGGGGFMRVAPEKMRKIAAHMVCLEHGKVDPNPKMAYKMVPIEQFTNDPRVRVLCEALGHNQLTQNTAQAAAWHITDGLSWQQLQAKNRVESKYTGNVRWFSPLELRSAQAAVAEIKRVVKESDEQRTTSTSQSESSAG